jgi:SRSO17 transposase
LDDQRALDIAAGWAAGHLDDGDAVLIVDETADEKSSTDAAGAARQYSGTVGGIALCQVAVTLTYATSRGHALIGRALYLPEACAADEEHRELAGVPEEMMFATKPQLAGGLPGREHSLGIRAAFVAGDEVYGGRELRRGIRRGGMGYVMAVRANHIITAGLAFPHAAQAIQITRKTRRPGSRKWRTETSYAITSLAAAQARPDQLATWIRGHWKIENQLHWVRDVTFGEDASTARTGTGPHVMATLRNLVISILRLAGYLSIAAALRHTARHPLRALRLLTGRK